MEEYKKGGSVRKKAKKPKAKAKTKALITNSNRVHIHINHPTARKRAAKRRSSGIPRMHPQNFQGQQWHQPFVTNILRSMPQYPQPAAVESNRSPLQMLSVRNSPSTPSDGMLKAPPNTPQSLDFSQNREIDIEPLLVFENEQKRQMEERDRREDLVRGIPPSPANVREIKPRNHNRHIDPNNILPTSRHWKP